MLLARMGQNLGSPVPPCWLRGDSYGRAPDKRGSLSMLETLPVPEMSASALRHEAPRLLEPEGINASSPSSTYPVVASNWIVHLYLRRPSQRRAFSYPIEDLCSCGFCKQEYTFELDACIWASSLTVRHWQPES